MLEKYSLLRQDFLNLAEPCIGSDALNQLKRNYEKGIDSKRKLSRAKDFGTFISLLEKRDIVSYKNVEPLRFISETFVRDPYLDSKLLDYENWLEAAHLPPFCDMYQSDEATPATSLRQHGPVAEEPVASRQSAYTSNFTQSPISSSGVQSSSTGTQTSHSRQQERRSSDADDKRKSLQEKVLQQIRDRLGRAWRDVARHLSIRECDIDAIQNKHPSDLKEQSYEFLKLYMSQSDTERWAINLIHALEKGRRKDLKELVEESILRNKI